MYIGIYTRVFEFLAETDREILKDKRSVFFYVKRTMEKLIFFPKFALSGRYIYMYIQRDRVESYFYVGMYIRAVPSARPFKTKAKFPPVNWEMKLNENLSFIGGSHIAMRSRYI